MTDHRGGGDPFEVELERVVRHVRRASPSTGANEAVSAVRALVQHLADAHACAVGMPSRPVFEQGGIQLPPDHLAEVLRAVAFDARTVTDVESLAPRVAEVRRLLSAHHAR